MSLWLFVLIFANQIDNDWLPLTELQVTGLGNYASNRDQILISSYKEPRLTVFDFTRVKIKTQTDGRIRAHIPEISPFGDGFAVFAIRLKIVYLLGKDSLFISQIRFSKFDGWQDHYKIMSVSPESDTSVLLSINVVKEKTMVLARLDINARSIAVLARVPMHDDYIQRWVYSDGSLYVITRETGQIDLYSSMSFQRIKTLRQPILPVKRKKKARRLRYFGIIGNPARVESLLYLHYNQHRDLFGELLDEPKRKVLVLNGDQISESNLMTYGSYKGIALVYDREAYEFKLIRAK